MDSKIKVLICIPSYTFGGSEIHSLNTARAIQKNTNYDVYFLAFGRIDTFKAKLEEEGFKTIHFSLNGFLDLGFLKKCIQLVKLFLFLRPYKFKYIFSGTEQCNLLMGLTWKLLRADKLFWHQWGIDKRINLSFWEKIVIKTKPCYIANSEACKNNIVQRHGIKVHNSVRVIHNTFDESILNCSLTSSTNTFNIAMLANFFDEKDHNTVLKALNIFLKKYSDSSIIVYFAGRDNGSNLLLKSKEVAFDLNLCGHVVFEGLVENTSKFLSKMNVAILSTKSEGLSNALLEYSAIGLPVIATNISQNIEALGDKNTEWLFPVGDEYTCFELIEKFYLDRSLIESVGNKNKIFVAENFSNNLYESKILELID